MELTNREGREVKRIEVGGVKGRGSEYILQNRYIQYPPEHPGVLYRRLQQEPEAAGIRGSILQETGN